MSKISIELEELTEAVKQWEQASHEIEQQLEHGWLLKDHLSRAQAMEAITQAMEAADRLQDILDRMLLQIERTSEQVEADR